MGECRSIRTLLLCFMFSTLPFSTQVYIWRFSPSLLSAHEPPLKVEPVSLLPWKDVPPSHWAYPFLLDLYRKGILKGTGKETFEGQKPVTRYEAAVILERTLEYLKNLWESPPP